MARRRVSPAPKTASHRTDRSAIRWIVGIGASAGGLEAFSQLLEGLEPDTGMAFVLVQHLAPRHKSLLADLLGARTTLPVVEAKDGMALRADHVVVIPPNCELTIDQGHLHLTARPAGPAQHEPINAFFRSLAQWGDGHCIGIVLSGLADDGAAGLREIKAVGGITIAQDPATARYDGMPRAAIATDVVDRVLSPAAIAVELNRVSRLPLLRVDARAARPLAAAAAKRDEPLQAVFRLLRQHSGVDFSEYKNSTILRRLNRRMVLNESTSVANYVKVLREKPGEVAGLFEDLLIHVTSFFRDPATFEALSARVLPQLLRDRADGAPLRMWVLGCATGEEAYSLAIVTLEALEAARISAPVQIFATDVSESAIRRARAATYPESAGSDLSADRLRRFFTRGDGLLRVNKPVRDCCIFARHDVTRDPPFSRLDLILCRNVLIYLGPTLQHRLVGALHYALRPKGFLMVGSAEGVGTHGELFASFDKANRIFVRNAAEGTVQAGTLGSVPTFVRDDPAQRVATRAPAATPLSQEASQLLLARYAPPGVIVDHELRVVHFRGQTGAYLDPTPGQASLLLLKMLRSGLRIGARSALDEARRTGAPARREGLPVDGEQLDRRVDVVVVPLPQPGGDAHPSPADPERHYLVLFEDPAARGGTTKAVAKARPAKRGGAATRPASLELVERLERELSESRDYLQSVNQELEAANAELQSANEEILSNNEELQSANEELDTAKEEMQSANEELNTVNDEVRGRNEELSRLNSDLNNLLAAVPIAVVIVGADLRIRRFTPKAERVLHLIPSDVGRPFTDLKPDVDIADFAGLLREVIETRREVERDVRDRQGRSYSLHVRPYESSEGRVDGAVLSLFDVDAAVRDREKTEAALLLADAVFATVRDPLAVLDANLRIDRVNPAFCTAFRIDPAAAVGARFDEVAGAGGTRLELLRRLAAVLATGQPFDDFALEVGGDAPSCRLLLNARPIDRADGKPRLLLLAASAPAS